VCTKVSIYALCPSESFDLKWTPVKHDIFLGDANACFISLKKAVRDLQALSASSAHLQMGQPMVRYVLVALMEVHLYTFHFRPDAVTVQIDPAMALGLNLDDFLGVSDTRLHASALRSCV
jgi:hypothetical protein